MRFTLGCYKRIGKASKSSENHTLQGFARPRPSNPSYRTRKKTIVNDWARKKYEKRNDASSRNAYPLYLTMRIEIAFYIYIHNQAKAIEIMQTSMYATTKADFWKSIWKTNDRRWSTGYPISALQDLACFLHQRQQKPGSRKYQLQQ